MDDDDSHDYPTLIALDPGGTTGWNVTMVHPDCLTDPDVSIIDNIMHYQQGQFEGPELEQVDQIIELVEAWDSAAIVCENFQLRTLAAELSPVTIRFGLQMYMRRESDVPRQIFLQMPQLVMEPVSDVRLKRWGLYRPGQEHARDSLRHTIMFLRQAKKDPRIRRAAWPSIYGVKV